MRRRLLIFLCVALYVPPGVAEPLQAPPEAALVLVGQEGADRPWVPDLRSPGRRVEIPADRRIDVLILGDGYFADERAAFELDVRSWYEGFLRLTPWKELRGAFRVRGLWTPSAARVTADEKSHYRIPATAFEVGDAGSNETSRAIFASIDRAGVNPARSGTRMTHAVVIMLMRNERVRNPSGLSRTIGSPDGRRSVSVGFAAYTHHEFGHAFGGLRDEYIRGVGSRTRRGPPDRLTMETLSNLSHTRDPNLVPWLHLAPGSAVNPDRESVIGVLWMGGVTEEGAWHSEARCLMNGTHENWDLGKTRRGVSLRDMTRFCFWCEEILVARVFEKTGLLGDGSDPAAMWKKWADEVRPAYHQAFDVPARIRAQNEENARSRFHEARIFERLTAP